MDEEREASKLNSLDQYGLAAAPSLVQPVLVTCIALCVDMPPEPTYPRGPPRTLTIPASTLLEPY